MPADLNGAQIPTFLYTTYESPAFARDARGRLWEGATVTYVALQLAFHMGFQQVFLVGVDHHFTTQGQANQTVVSEGDDPNHFSPAYFGQGFAGSFPISRPRKWRTSWPETLSRLPAAKSSMPLLGAIFKCSPRSITPHCSDES